MDLNDLRDQISNKKSELAVLQALLRETRKQEKTPVVKKKHGRPLLGAAPMTAAERVRKYRANKKQA